ncbi:uncharacterized protein LOC101775082 [Setaria italica]|uniref:uncharacterized protein LOC101775082 n=1 Tax=Setaria italica TaxID=4555 RepID=UPI00035127C7|nr:uncharacterized protein LOC101775082 [Setaria italica]
MGPGDPELLTLKAVRGIEAADLVLYDWLVSNDMLDLVGEGARLLYVGKMAGYHSRTQQASRDSRTMKPTKDRIFPKQAKEKGEGRTTGFLSLRSSPAASSGRRRGRPRARGRGWSRPWPAAASGPPFWLPGISSLPLFLSELHLCARPRERSPCV